MLVVGLMIRAGIVFYLLKIIHRGYKNITRRD